MLLDLGDYPRARSAADDDFVLDIDLDETPEPSPVEPVFPTASFRSRQSYGIGTGTVAKPLNGQSYAATMPAELPGATTDPLANTQEWEREPIEPAVVAASEAPRPVPRLTEVSEVSAMQLSQETIDAIARRAVEQLSEKVVQEIAWEVVPQLAELLIKRQLEEKNS